MQFQRKLLCSERCTLKGKVALRILQPLMVYLDAIWLSRVSAAFPAPSWQTAKSSYLVCFLMALSMLVKKLTPVLVMSSQGANRDVLNSSKSGRITGDGKEADSIYIQFWGTWQEDQSVAGKESSKISHKAEQHFLMGNSYFDSNFAAQMLLI